MVLDVYPQQAAAGLYTTPTDLATFIIEMQKAYRGKSQLLQQASAKTMLTAQANISEGGFREQIGVSPFLLQRIDNQEEKGIYFEHTGANAGFTAYAIGNLTEGEGAVIMLNSGDDFDGLGKEIRRAIAQTYNWYHFLPETIKPKPMPTKTLDEYVGRYRRDADVIVELRRENNYLVEVIRENLGEGKNIYCFPVASDTIVFTDFAVKGFFKRDAQGQVNGLQTIYQKEPMQRMKADEFAPHELLKQGRYAEAKAAYRALNMSESQVTYIVYEYMAKKGCNMEIVKNWLELAAELYPKSSMVWNRWGDYFLKIKDKAQALLSYQKALQLNPTDESLQTTIRELSQ